MRTFRYSKWDGSQDLPGMDKDELMNELSRELVSYGDLNEVLRGMQREGVFANRGTRIPGIQDLLRKLRQVRQDWLDKYNLGSVMGDIHRKLSDIVETERREIQERLNEARGKAEQDADGLSPEMLKNLLQVVEDMAQKNMEKLNSLPQDAGGRIKELTQYNFMGENSKRKFQDLLETLRKHALESYARDLGQRVKQMDPDTLASIRQMAEAINKMLEERMRGHEPNFNKFLEQFGDFFGPQPPQSLDDLIEHLQQGMTQAQALLDNLSPDDSQALKNLIRSVFDERTQCELARLANNLDALRPLERGTRRYPFSGEESISYSEALKLIELLQKSEELEGQLRDSQYSGALEGVNDNLAREVMGDEGAQQLETIRDIARVLEEAGYIKRTDRGYELTPRGIRKLGQRALGDIFAQLRRDRAGSHWINRRGVGVEKSDDTKKYEFGDHFHLDLQKTLTNALSRDTETPVRLKPEDFEVYGTHQVTRSATALMLDLSLSMPMRGNFEAAKRVAIALDALIRSQYPQDTLFIIGFSSYARRVAKENLASLYWDELDPYTNIQHGLSLAKKLLSKERCSNKQIILITDGEPTAHVEGGIFSFHYPTSFRTMQLTLKEVKNCTQKGIVINTFMLQSASMTGAFVTRMAQINKGRIFFANASSLGQYLLWDYVSSKKSKVI
ncbi:MAG: VWA domain-containing protein [Chloroflexi bacterium]|nr:VWA domain-containing protein [Chloroflexota bacterium]